MSLAKGLAKVGLGFIILPYNALAGGILMYMGINESIEEKEKSNRDKRVYTDQIRQSIAEQLAHKERNRNRNDIIDCYYYKD